MSPCSAATPNLASATLACRTPRTVLSRPGGVVGEKWSLGRSVRESSEVQRSDCVLPYVRYTIRIFIEQSTSIMSPWNSCKATSSAINGLSA